MLTMNPLTADFVYKYIILNSEESILSAIAYRLEILKKSSYKTKSAFCYGTTNILITSSKGKHEYDSQLDYIRRRGIIEVQS